MRARKRLANLRALSTQAGLTIRLDELDQQQRQFAQILRDMLAAHFRGRAADAITQDRVVKFEAERREFDALLASVATQAETTITESEEKAKTQVQGGAATVDWLGDLFSQTLNETFPLLQGVYKLMRDTVRIEELAKSYVNQADAAALPADRTEYQSDPEDRRRSGSQIWRAPAHAGRPGPGRKDHAGCHQARSGAGGGRGHLCGSSQQSGGAGATRRVEPDSWHRGKRLCRAAGRSRADGSRPQRTGQDEFGARRRAGSDHHRLRHRRGPVDRRRVRRHFCEPHRWTDPAADQRHDRARARHPECGRARPRPKRRDRRHGGGTASLQGERDRIRTGSSRSARGNRRPRSSRPGASHSCASITRHR